MRRVAKLAVVVALVAAGGALALVGALPEGLRSVSDLAADPARFEGREVELKATVLEGSLDRNATPMRFLVGDGSAVLEVRWDPALPLPDHEAGGTIEGKNVVVHGVLRREGDAIFLLANDMQVGCASKYEPDRAA